MREEDTRLVADRATRDTKYLTERVGPDMTPQCYGEARATGRALSYVTYLVSSGLPKQPQVLRGTGIGTSSALEFGHSRCLVYLRTAAKIQQVRPDKKKDD
jgi:hypothetical protein